MTTVTLLVNGEDNSAVREQKDAEINMVTGYKDLCVGKMDNFALKENKSENYQVEIKNALAGVMNSEDKKFEHQMNLLKELVACHLDMILQQSEQLAVRDRIINQLKKENETLNMRIIRMERRVNLRRERSPEEGGRPGPVGRSLSDCSGGLRDSPLTPATPSLTSMDPHKRRSTHRRLSTDSNATVTSKKSLSLCSSKKKKSDADQNHLKNAKLVTKDLYYTSVGEQDCWWGEPTQVKPLSQLEVPSWRQKILTSSYTMEGTENLTDEAFKRRHTRQYQDEKRRKRWDVQRIREMRHNERLRQRERARQDGVSGQPDCFNSLWPSPTSHTHLIVQNRSGVQGVPVSVLGLTLPKYPLKDFAFSSFREVDSKGLRNHRRLRR